MDRHRLGLAELRTEAMPRPTTDTEAALLREFLAAGGDYVSGTRLAELAGISRVAVRDHIHRLEAEGFRFAAHHGRGYRMEGRPGATSPALVRALVREPVELLYFETIDSTNEEAGRQLAQGRAAPFVVLAAAQTRGRGRFGRVWHSPAAVGNLYLSFGFRPDLPPERMHLFTLWMGLRLCRLIVECTGAKPRLKWPNDLYFGDRKTGGMLTEARIDSDRTRELVFGLGLNVTTEPSAWSAELAARATSLAMAAGHPLDINEIAAAVVGCVLAAYDCFAKAPPLDEIADLWGEYDMLSGRQVTVQQGAESHTGTVRGIDNEGALMVRTDTGRTLRFRAGEVTLRPALR
jgi:BirA family biotin operon repressor/biotin-[acetyl-CoA-carboxylase] ligase